MWSKFYLCVCLSVAGAQAVGRPGVVSQVQSENVAKHRRSLLNTFPFNQPSDEEETLRSHAHDYLHNNGFVRQAGQPDRNSLISLKEAHILRQGEADTAFRASEDGLTTLDAVAAITPDENGRRCIQKVMMVEETEYKDIVNCDHSYDTRCHISYTTKFESQQEQECEENYRKNCYIDYEKVAYNETVTVCRTPLVRDCEVKTGDPICRNEYESECSTRNHAHEVEDDVVNCKTVEDEKCEDITEGYITEPKCTTWPRLECDVMKKNVTKYTPETSCIKVPTVMCAPPGCGFKQGPEECYEKVQTVIQDKPTEECSIEPQRVCKHVTKLVPKLEPKEECVDVPKEVCTRSKGQGKRVQKPVLQNWCYTPSETNKLA